MGLPQTASPPSLRWWAFLIVDQDGKLTDLPEVIIGTGHTEEEARDAAQALARPATIVTRPNTNTAEAGELYHKFSTIAEVTGTSKLLPPSDNRSLSDWHSIAELLQARPAIRLSVFEFNYAFAVGLKQAGAYIEALIVAYQLLRGLPPTDTHMRKRVDALIREILEALGTNGRELIREIREALGTKGIDEKLDWKQKLH